MELPKVNTGEWFECAECGKKDISNCSHEEKLEELARNLNTGIMPLDPSGQYSIICDDCYKALGYK